MDYEKKYLKYKSKYNLKKSSLLRGEESIMKGGNPFVDKVFDLVSRNVPMLNMDDYLFSNTISSNKGEEKSYKINLTSFNEKQISFNNEKGEVITILINKEWENFIEFTMFNNFVQIHFNRDFRVNDEDGLEHIQKGRTKSGESLLYLAAQNLNIKMFDALVGMGVELVTLNADNSSILHGVAQGKESNPIKTYEDKVKFIQIVLERHPQAISLLFNVNIHGNTCYDNLLICHPDKISKYLENVAFPYDWIRKNDTVQHHVYYVNPSNNESQWKRPY